MYESGVNASVRARGAFETLFKCISLDNRYLSTLSLSLSHPRLPLPPPIALTFAMSPLPASGTASADVKAESTLARVLGAGTCNDMLPH